MAYKGFEKPGRTQEERMKLTSERCDPHTTEDLIERHLQVRGGYRYEVAKKYGKKVEKDEIKIRDEKAVKEHQEIMAKAAMYGSLYGEELNPMTGAK